jgi:hypothetical protein
MIERSENTPDAREGVAATVNLSSPEAARLRSADAEFPCRWRLPCSEVGLVLPPLARPSSPDTARLKIAFLGIESLNTSCIII